MNIPSQDQKALMDIAVANILRTLRKLTARGVSNYKAKSPDGHKIEVVFYKAGFFAHSNAVRYRIYLTRYLQAADGAFEAHPSEYEFQLNSTPIRRLAPDSTGKMVSDRHATMADLLDLNSYLLTWKKMPAQYR